MKYLKLEFCKKTVDFFGTIGRLLITIYGIIILDNY